MNIIFLVGILRHTRDAPKKKKKKEPISDESQSGIRIKGFVARRQEQFHELAGVETRIEGVLHVL